MTIEYTTTCRVTLKRFYIYCFLKVYAFPPPVDASVRHGHSGVQLLSESPCRSWKYQSNICTFVE